MLTDVDKLKLAKILQQDAEELDAFFDEIDAVVSLYLCNKEAVKEMPKRAKRKADLKKLSKAFAVLLERKPAAELLFAGTQEYAALLASAGTLNQILQNVVDAPSARGPEADDRYWLIDRLAGLFIEATGRTPTITWDDLEGVYSGTFYDFCWTVLPDFQETALGKKIREVLAQRKKEEKQQ